MHLTQALAILDSDTDEHWTGAGQARLDVVSELMGRQITRAEVIAAAPTFTRETADDLVVSEGAATRESDPAQTAPPAAVPETHQPTDPRTGLEEEPDEDDDVPQAATPPAISPGVPPAATTPNAGPAVQAPSATSGEPMDLEDDSILRMPAKTVLASEELTEHAFLVINHKANKLLVQKREIEKQLATLYHQSDVLSMNKERLIKEDPNRSTNEIQHVLDVGNAARAKKVEAAQRYLAAGTNAKDLAALVNPRSKLDQAMARKTGFGKQVPGFRAKAS